MITPNDDNGGNRGSGDIVVLGGYGEVGKRAAAFLAPRHPGAVVVAGRRIEAARSVAESVGHGARPLALDVNDPAASAVLEGAALVILCCDARGPELMRAIVERGRAWVDVTAHIGWHREPFAMSGAARAAGARVIVGSGMVPGVASVMARLCVDEAGRGGTVDMCMLTGAGDTIGEAAIAQLLEETTRKHPVLEDGRERPARNYDRSRVVDYPAPFGRRRAWRFVALDLLAAGRTLGARTARAWAALDPSWPGTVTGVMMKLGLPLLLRSAAVRRAMVRSTRDMQRRHAGRDGWALVVEVEGPSGRARREMTGRNASRLTAVAAALMGERILDGALPPGVWLPEEVIAPQPFLDDLAAALAD